MIKLEYIPLKSLKISGHAEPEDSKDKNYARVCAALSIISEIKDEFFDIETHTSTDDDNYTIIHFYTKKAENEPVIKNIALYRESWIMDRIRALYTSYGQYFEPMEYLHDEY